MFARSLNFRSILAAAAMSMATFAPGGVGVGMPSTPVRSAIRPQANQKKLKKGGKYASVQSYPNGPGWGIAKVKRMAAKKRNQIRNRKAHRN